MGLIGFLHWTEEEVNLLISRWNEGNTAAVIAAELGKTRNAVIGKAHRLKLSKPRPPAKARRAPVRKRPQYNPKASKMASPEAGSVAPVPILAPQPVEGGVPILDLEHHHCRAVVGTGPDGLARFCGAPKEGRIKALRGGSFESAYCITHGEAFYQRGAVVR